MMTYRMQFLSKPKPVFHSREPVSSDCEPEYANRHPTGTGNEADIEDNLVPVPCTPSPIEVHRKLRQKPADSLPATPCKIAMEREKGLRRNATRPAATTERLSYRPRTVLESMSKTIEKPKGCVPPTSLPHWHSLPLTNRIPYIKAPGGLLYYSPGKLSAQLARETKWYNLTDPYNRERVVRSPYTALNDPHAKDFIKKPQTKQLLYKQGLINENDEVIYSHREFNVYRDYLRTVHSDDVRQVVQGADELWKKDQEQLRRINSYESQNGKAALLQRKLDRYRRIQENKKLYLISRYRFKQQQTALKLAAFAKHKEERIAEKVARSAERKRQQMENLKALQKAEEKAILMTCKNTVEKTIQSVERRREYFANSKQVQRRSLLEWIDLRINQSHEQLDRDKSLEYTQKETLRLMAAKRQRRVELHQANMPLSIEKRKQKEYYEWMLAVKYFKKWRINMERRMIMSTQSHTSCWTTLLSGTLEKTAEYLRFNSDYHDKLDDFILQILEMKDAIRQEFDLEDAELHMEDETIEGSLEDSIQSELSDATGKRRETESLPELIQSSRSESLDSTKSSECPTLETSFDVDKD